MILNVYKEKDMTSRDVVNILSKHFHTKKIGHTGTLDPIATGVLIICTEKDTKLVELLTSKEKEYIATIKLGIKTNTGDITGEVIETKPYNFTKEELIKVLNSFLGESIQTVPIYSAVKVNGKKLYEYARNNISIELPKRPITISNIELISYQEETIVFKVTVSKGTYIRSLIEDICTKLNTVGTMLNLERTKQGKYKVEDSNKIESILNNNYKEISKLEALSNYKIYNLNDIEYHKVSNGSKMNFNSNEDKLLLLYNNNPISIYYKEDNIYRIYKML